VANEHGAQNKNKVSASQLVSRMFPEACCSGSAHIDHRKSNAVATARHVESMAFGSNSSAPEKLHQKKV
jgi:hypothetical protein